MTEAHGALTGAPRPRTVRSGSPGPAVRVTVAPFPEPSVDTGVPAPGSELAPVLDADGLLRHHGRWVSIPDTQLAVVALLVRNLGRLVGNHEVRRVYEEAGGSGTSTSLRSLVHRLGQRVARVDLTLHVVRSRGLVLDVSSS
jgi:hypothetical protein